MIAPLRKDIIVQYDSIYVSFYGFFFILLTTRSVEHENSNKKRGVEIAKEIKVTENQKGQSCKNIQSRATGIFGHATHRTKTNNLVRTTRFWNKLLQVRSQSNVCKAKYSFWRNKTKVPKHESQNHLWSPKTTANNKTATT